MLELSIRGLLSLFETLRPAFTRPSWLNFVQVALGWVLVPGRHGVGAALVVGRGVGSSPSRELPSVVIGRQLL